jgi:hypothetical protein
MVFMMFIVFLFWSKLNWLFQLCFFSTGIKTTGNLTLDLSNLAILILLQTDASLISKTITFKLHKSIAKIHERKKRLMEQSIFQGYWL